MTLGKFFINLNLKDSTFFINLAWLYNHWNHNARVFFFSIIWIWKDFFFIKWIWKDSSLISLQYLNLKIQCELFINQMVKHTEKILHIFFYINKMWKDTFLFYFHGLDVKSDCMFSLWIGSEKKLYVFFFQNLKLKRHFTFFW